MSSAFFPRDEKQPLARTRRVDPKQVSEALARAIQTAVNGNPFMKVENESSSDSVNNRAIQWSNGLQP